MIDAGPFSERCACAFTSVAPLLGNVVVGTAVRTSIPWSPDHWRRIVSVELACREARTHSGAESNEVRSCVRACVCVGRGAVASVRVSAYAIVIGVNRGGVQTHGKTRPTRVRTARGPCAQRMGWSRNTPGPGHASLRPPVPRNGWQVARPPYRRDRKRRHYDDAGSRLRRAS